MCVEGGREGETNVFWDRHQKSAVGLSSLIGQQDPRTETVTAVLGSSSPGTPAPELCMCAQGRLIHAAVQLGQFSQLPAFLDLVLQAPEEDAFTGMFCWTLLYRSIPGTECSRLNPYECYWLLLRSQVRLIANQAALFTAAASSSLGAAKTLFLPSYLHLPCEIRGLEGLFLWYSPAEQFSSECHLMKQIIMK